MCVWEIVREKWFKSVFIKIIKWILYSKILVWKRFWLNGVCGGEREFSVMGKLIFVGEFSVDLF